MTRLRHMGEICVDLDEKGITVESWTITKDDMYVMTFADAETYERAPELFRVPLGRSKVTYRGVTVRVQLGRRAGGVKRQPPEAWMPSDIQAGGDDPAD